MSSVGNLESKIWVEKYAPQCVEDTILPNRIKSVLREFVTSGEIKSYTAVGHPGVGKTSSANAVLNEMGLLDDALFINASEKGGIDTIRTRIREYASKMTLNDRGYKVVVLDEADGLTIAAQDALRGVIEEFQDTCRFILTANKSNRISDAITSRCPLIDFKFHDRKERNELLKQFFSRIEAILVENGVSYDRKELLKFCDRNFPDFRKSINLISRNIVDGVLELGNVGSANDDVIEELIGYIKGCNWTNMRKWVAESMDTEPNNIRQALYENLVPQVTVASMVCITILINKYDYQEAFVVSQEINMASLFSEMIQSVAAGDIEFK